MSETISKGMLALRQNNAKGEKITVDGETFYFKKLTIDMEEQLDGIAKANQNPDLTPPEAPKDTTDRAAMLAFDNDLLTFKQESAKSFRKVTAEIMKYVLLDDNNKPLFDADDDVYSLLNNVYAEKFFKAYMKFRQGAEAGPAEAERRFPN